MKKVFIGVLAALMLFAFTACDNQMGYKTPVGISAVASQTEYLEGETFDPSTVSVVVDYSDGSSRTMTGAEAGLATAEITVGANTYPVSYGMADQNGYKPSTVITVMGYKADSAVISNLPTTGTLKDGKVDVDFSATTVTVSYNNGKTRTLEAGEYKITPSITASAGKQTATATLTVFEKPVSSTTTPATWEVTVSAAPAEEGEYDATKANGLTVKYTDDKGNDITSSIAAGTFYVNDKINWEVYLVDKEGNTKVATENTDYWFTNGKKPASKSVTLGKDNLKAAISYTVVPLDGSDVTITIPKATDYVASIKGIYPLAQGGPTNGTPATLANFEFTYALASDPDVTVETPIQGSAIGSTETRIAGVILDPTVPEDLKTYKPRFAMTWGKPVDGKLSSGNVLFAESSALVKE